MFDVALVGLPMTLLSICYMLLASRYLLSSNSGKQVTPHHSPLPLVLFYSPLYTYELIFLPPQLEHRGGNQYKLALWVEPKRKYFPNNIVGQNPPEPFSCIDLNLIDVIQDIHHHL